LNESNSTKLSQEEFLNKLLEIELNQTIEWDKKNTPTEQKQQEVEKPKTDDKWWQKQPEAPKQEVPKEQGEIEKQKEIKKTIRQQLDDWNFREFIDEKWNKHTIDFSSDEKKCIIDNKSLDIKVFTKDKTETDFIDKTWDVTFSKITLGEIIYKGHFFIFSKNGTYKPIIDEQVSFVENIVNKKSHEVEFDSTDDKWNKDGWRIKIMIT
jgi:hypothetical protein